MKVRVPVIGRPMPKVSWEKDREPIAQSDRINLVQDELSAMLIIKDSCRSDKGLYGIKVDNYLGCDEATFLVNITGKRIISADNFSHDQTKLLKESSNYFANRFSLTSQQNI